MKGFLSFRTKLIFTVFPVVAGVTTAALLVAERKFSQSYELLFQQQFDSQISQLNESREARLEMLSAALERMAALPAVVEGMRKEDVRGVQEVLRTAMESLLRERLVPGAVSGWARGTGASAGGGGLGFRGPGSTSVRGDKRGLSGNGKAVPEAGRKGSSPAGGAQGGGGSRPPQRQASFVALMGRDGSIIAGQRDSRLVPLLTGDDGEAGGEMVRRGAGRFHGLDEVSIDRMLDGLKVGYWVVEIGGSGNEQIREVFVAPIRDPETGVFLGGMVVGIPLSEVGERLLFERTKLGDMGEIRSGIWVEGRLFSSTIPERFGSEIGAYVSRLEREAADGVSKTTLEIEGRPHQVIGRLLNPDSPFPKAAQVSLYPLRELEKEVSGLRKSVAGLGLAALVLALGLVMFVSRGLSGPIRDLVSGVEEIEKGNYGVRVPVSGGDEIGRLGSAFNEMAAGLALQEKYRSVLNAVADPTVAKQLMENQSALGGQLQGVTMLFCDIRGFTAMTENMSPAEVIDLLNHHMTAMTEVAYRHGGIVDKFVGDLIMVLFGAPFRGEGDALNAVSCAQEMQRVRRELNAGAPRPLETGIGIATGDVVAGCMGSDQRLSYTVVGARVNLASRLCSVAQAGEIVLDEPTWEVVKSRIRAEPMQPLQLKGFSGPVACYRVTGGA